MNERALAVPREYTAIEKAAVLLASLEHGAAAKVLQRLAPDAMLRVTQAIRNLGVVPGPDRDRIVRECLGGIRQMGNAVQGDDRSATSLLSEVMGEKEAAAFLSRNAASREETSGIARMDPRQAASLLEQEPPGIAALILRRLSGRVAAAILEAMPRAAARRAVVFMCSSRPPSEKAARRVEAVLAMQCGDDAAPGATVGDDPLEAVAAILQQADKDLGGELLDAVRERSAETADRLRDRLFTFEDIVRLTDTDMRRLLSEIDTGDLALAIRGASEGVREKFFRNMSTRAADALREEMEFAQKVRLSEVQVRRRAVVDVIRRLESEGQISTGGEDYV